MPSLGSSPHAKVAASRPPRAAYSHSAIRREDVVAVPIADEDVGFSLYLAYLSVHPTPALTAFLECIQGSDS